MDCASNVFSTAFFDAAEKCVEDSGLTSLVKKSFALRQYFCTSCGESIRVGPFFTYALSWIMFWLRWRRALNGMCLDGPAGKILARSFAAHRTLRALARNWPHVENRETADLSLQEAGSREVSVAALGAGLAGTGKPEMKERMRASLAGAFPGATVSILRIWKWLWRAAGEGPVHRPCRWNRIRCHWP